MKSSAGKIQLTGFNDLFRTDDGVEANGERVQDISLAELFPFKDHPFQVRDDEAMQAVSGVSTDFRRTYTQHTILPRMCREPSQAEQTGLGQEKEGRCVEKVISENPLISTVSASSSIEGQYVYIPNLKNDPLKRLQIGR